MKPSRLSLILPALLAVVHPTLGCSPREAPVAAADRALQPPPPDQGSSPAAASPEDADPPQRADSSEEDSSIAKPPPFTPIGVVECDRFVGKYVACVDLHVPVDRRDELMRELHVHRARWRELQKMQDGNLAASLSCRGVAQRLKGDLAVDYGCEF